MKICIVRTDKMGDMILTLPIVQGLEKQMKIVKLMWYVLVSNHKICNKFKSINNNFFGEIIF